MQKQRQENERIQRSLSKDRAQDQFYLGDDTYETRLDSIRRQIQIAMSMSPEQGQPLAQKSAPGTRPEPQDLSVSGLQVEQQPV